MARRFASAVVVVAVGAVSLLVPPAAGAAAAATATAAPRLSVTPSKGLADGQIVTVKGSGFAPRRAVAMAECESSATGEAG